MTAGTTLRLVLAATAVLALADLAAAQTMTGVPNALQGFSVNREQPVHIKSTSLEIRDKQKRATFIGDVHVAQGDTTMKSNTLDVFYDQEANPVQSKPAQQPAQPAQPEGGQQIRRLEAKGNVVVTQKEQTATGDTAVFDTTANTVTLNGTVVVTHGPNVLRGERLIVHLGTGVSVFEGKVYGLFSTNSARAKAGDSKPGESKPPESKPGEPRSDAKPADSKPDAGRSKDAARPAAKSTPGQPLRLN
jgi:lipopolysaccharide export system protein LptA